MEEKLHQLVDKIENSDLPTEEKIEIFTFLHELLRGIIWPILAQHVDQQKLSQLAEEVSSLPQKDRVERYYVLISAAVKDGQVMTKLNKVVGRIIDSATEFVEQRLG